MKVFFLFLFLIFCLSSENEGIVKSQPSVIFPFYSGKTIVKPTEISNDSTRLVLDTLGHPLFYFSEVFTEVCETKVCFPVQLTLYWDFAGSFLGFSVPDEYALTKVGHQKFSRNDYFQLYTLLNNPDSKLGRLSKKELVRHNSIPENEPDTFTGETIHVKGESLVTGAAFSCFTLWEKVYKTNGFSSVKFEQEIDYPGKKSLNSWKNELGDVQEISHGKLAMLLKEGNDLHYLRKFSIQQLLTNKLESLSPLKCLIINNYLNRQKYLYPEIKDKLKQCKSIKDCFNKMVPLEVRS